MQNRLNDLFVRFKTKGFLPIELPDLVKDTLNLVGSEECLSINDVNYELEELGWGIGIVDNVTYELIDSLVENTSFPDVERHIRS